MKIVLIGPPSVGKGTCARKLSERYGIPHISTGSMVREEISRGSELALVLREYVEKGLLVPDHIIIPLVHRRLSMPDCRRGFILDGYPRTLRQAVELDREFSVDVVFLLDAPLEVLVERATGRYICPVCGEIYHAKWRPPREDLLCDKCGSRLEKRSDDTPEVLVNRYRVYKETFTPIIDYYKERSVLVVIDASTHTDMVVEAIVKELERRRFTKL